MRGPGCWIEQPPRLRPLPAVDITGSCALRNRPGMLGRPRRTSGCAPTTWLRRCSARPSAMSRYRRAHQSMSPRWSLSGGHHMRDPGSRRAQASPRSGSAPPTCAKIRRARPDLPHGLHPGKHRDRLAGPVRRPSNGLCGNAWRSADWRRRRPGQHPRPPASAAIDSTPATTAYRARTRWPTDRRRRAGASTDR